VISFSREKAGDRVVVIANMSNKPLVVALQTKEQAGKYANVFKPIQNVLSGKDRWGMAPWGYVVLSSQK
jgi:hypothetical protein